MADSWWRALLAILVWPGLLAGAVSGWFLLWLSRKVTARLQGRQGPPFYQPFFDFWKLVGKNTLIPRGANPVVFYALPILSVVSVVFALALLPVPGGTMISFQGDLVLLIYLLEMPALMDILAGYVTHSVYAEVGSAREALLSLAYNLPFISALVALALKAGSFQLGTIAAMAISPVHFLAALALFLAILARLRVNPFSIPNAEEEIVAGIHVEYNGLPLALFELTHGMEAAALVGLLAGLFSGSIASPGPELAAFWLIALVVVLLICLVAAGTARLKVQHAFRFYWTWGFLAAALVLIGALIF
ncbi:MAG TPA: complex I subunit 1 family protein [Anaerolineaceae bacterium]|nr:complex I subunit 1 family protein [Anaerolineaceae bacterium]